MNVRNFKTKRLLRSGIPLHAWLADNINYCSEHAKQHSAMQTSYKLARGLTDQNNLPYSGFLSEESVLQDSGPVDN